MAYGEGVALELGIRGEASMIVQAHQTAVAVGTGDAEVLSTSSLLEVMQQATMDALAGNLPEGAITAGLRVNLDHLRGTTVGNEVKATATLVRIEGRRLIFEAEAHCDNQLCGTARIIRVRIEKERFLAGL